MSLHPTLLRESFQAVLHKADQLTACFYDTLFLRHPELRPLFAGVRMDAQRKMLVRSLALILRVWEDPAGLSLYLEELGRVHVAYGAEDGHYDAFGECLLHALAETAGPLWNEDMARAWADAYEAIAGLMRSGAAAGAAA